MQAIIKPGNVSGTIHAPTSKSMMQRVCAAALLHKGTTTIVNPGHADDDKAALGIIQQLGATVRMLKDKTIEVTSDGKIHASSYIDCGESGLSARLFTPIAALSDQPITIQGKGTLLHRPMDLFKNILPSLGVAMPHFSGCIPFTVQGPLQPASIKVNGALSSQFISGLLFALAYTTKEKITLRVKDLKSIPYIQLTLEVLKDFGRPIVNNDYKIFHIDPTNFHNASHINTIIESDWSSAACWLVAGAIAGDVHITGLNLQSEQADIAILPLLQHICNTVSVQKDNIHVSASPLQAFAFDATHCPDLFPILSILAGCCNGTSTIKGMHRLLHKESNRIGSIIHMLQQFRIPHYFSDDTLHISGIKNFSGCGIDSHNDHRIVMAAAIGALRASTLVNIQGAEAITKSYPDFFKHLSTAGIQHTLKND